MKKIILAILASAVTLSADTSSMDITITDMKEAIYRLIKDVSYIKKTSGAASKESGATKEDIMRIEKRQRELELKIDALARSIKGGHASTVGTKTSKSKYDKEISNYVQNNLELLKD